MGNPEVMRGAPEIPWSDRELIGKILFAPQALATTITGSNGIIGRTMKFLTNPLVLLSAAGLAAGYHKGWFDSLPGVVKDTANVAGQKISFGAQNAYNWLGSRVGIGPGGPIDRMGNVHNLGTMSPQVTEVLDRPSTIMPPIPPPEVLPPPPRA